MCPKHFIGVDTMSSIIPFDFFCLNQCDTNKKVKPDNNREKND